MCVTPAMADWMVSSSHALRLNVVQGRFLAALEITIWGGGDLVKGRRFYMTVV